MALLDYTGDIQISFNKSKDTAFIEYLYLFDNESEPITTDYVLKIIEHKNIKAEIQENLISFWLDKVDHENRSAENIPILNSVKPLKKNSERLVYNFDYDIDPSNTAVWWMFHYCLKNFHINDYFRLPFKMKLLDAGEIIGEILREEKDIDGKDIFGNKILAEKSKITKFKAGKGVNYDLKKNIYVAKKSGYLVIINNTIMIEDSFFVTEDKLKMYYKNFPRKSKNFHSIESFNHYLKFNKIDKDCLVNEISELEVDEFENILILKGKEPENSKDAEILKLLEVKKIIGTLNSNGKIDYKEIQKYRSIKKNDVIAIKMLSKRGKNGFDIYGHTIKSRNPKDFPIYSGNNTFKDIKNQILSIHSNIDGILEIKDNVASVEPVIKIKKNIDYSTGNIRTHAHVEIFGSVLNGFSVYSSKSIIIRGKIENNCEIHSGGDLLVSEGIIGDKTKIFSDGDLCTSFIENSNIRCMGNILIEKFIMGTHLVGSGNIKILGNIFRSENHGVVIDSTIKVKKKLEISELGNAAGLKNFIYFGYDDKIFDSIKKILREIEAINIKKINQLDKFPFSFLHNSLRERLRHFDDKKKKEVISALKKYRKFEKRQEILKKMLKKEYVKKKYMEKYSYVDIREKIFPPLVLHISDTQRVIQIEKYQRRFFFNSETIKIEDK